MSYCQFLKALFADGRVTVPEFAPLADADVAAGNAILAGYEQLNRLEMPGAAPGFAANTGRWAGTRLFRACQFLIYRDLAEEKIHEELARPVGGPATPEVHYGVDLVFRFLPDVTRLARSAAEHDPLLQYLDGWARQWPLSSVGMPGIEAVDIAEFEENPSLLRLYAERIIARQDNSRLSAPSARNAVREALGMFPELDERMASALLQYDQHDRTESGLQEQEQ